MRFIGSKSALLDKIEKTVIENTTGSESVFCDIFAGTGVVAQRFKPRYEILSNDTLHFSYVIQKATVENNSVPVFDKLKGIGILDPFKFLEETKIDIVNYNDDHYFITKNYAPHDGCERMYVSCKNAARIDFIRNTIEAWKRTSLLNEAEYFYLLAGLIEGVPSVSNITGTYGAYLKQWDKRAYKKFELTRLNVIDNSRRNKSYNMDANKLIEEIDGDILYMDPPYNGRQYIPNYHLLETISRYDNPQIKGVTGMRPYEEEKSSFCIKNQVTEAFENLVGKARFTHLVMSYSSDGLMKGHEIETILKKYGIADSYKRYDIPYRKYKSKIINEDDTLFEYIFYIRKKTSKPIYYLISEPKELRAASPGIQTVSAKKYIKSPLNYIGGKYKLLPQIMPLFPSDIAVFTDLFSGGANVGINIVADKVICNDINTKIIEMFRSFQKLPIAEILSRIYRNIDQFQLSKHNEDGFLRFREYYNRTRDPIDLYTLTCYSFNYQFRFNNDHEYNNPFGRERSHFSENMKNSLLAFVDRLHKMDVTFTNQDFITYDISNLGPQDMIYCDPPYLITTGSYNDGNRGFKNWGGNEEWLLYEFLDRVNARNIRFALSNVMEHKGKTNPLLFEWSRKYKVIYLESNYSNSSYNTTRGDSKEVLITNYE